MSVFEHEKAIQTMDDNERYEYVKSIESVEDNIMLLKFLSEESKLKILKEKAGGIHSFLNYTNDESLDYIKLEYAKQFKNYLAMESISDFWVPNLMVLVKQENRIKLLEMLKNGELSSRIWMSIIESAKSYEEKKELIKLLNDDGGYSSRCSAISYYFSRDGEKIMDILRTVPIKSESQKSHFAERINNKEYIWEAIDFFEEDRNISKFIIKAIKEELKENNELSEEIKEKIYSQINRMKDPYQITEIIEVSKLSAHEVVKNLKSDEARLTAIFDLIDDYRGKWNFKDFIDLLEKNKNKISLIEKANKGNAAAISEYLKEQPNCSALLRSWFLECREERKTFFYLDEDLINESLDEVQIMIVDKYKKITNEKVADTAVNYLIDNNIRDEEQINDVFALVSRIMNSNSEEIIRCCEGIVSFVIDKENRDDILDDIEQTFMKSDIPYVGKLFEVFKFLHESKDDYKNQSPVLSAYMSRKDGAFKHNVENMDIIIFNDLLKCSFESNNRDLRKFLDDVEKGNKLLTYIQKKNISISDLKGENKTILKKYLDKVEKVLDRYDYFIKGEKGKNNDVDLEKRLENVMSILKADKIDYKKIPDMIIQRFCGFTAIKDFETAKIYINGIKEKIDLENRERSKYPFTLEKGDFVKGLGDYKYLESILQNGSVAKEFLGSSADSDLTPLDTDLSRIIYTDAKKETIGEYISGLAANAYGPIWCVLKNNPDKIEITRTKDNREYKPHKVSFSKLEAFCCGGDDHYGIRTGFPSSDISYFVTDEYSKEVGFEIVKNGFYIPVVNKKGELVFSPDDYDKLRGKMSGLKYYNEWLYKFSNNLINDDVINLSRQIEDNMLEAKEKRQMILKLVEEAVNELGLELKTQISDDVTKGFVEFIDTGSTGRGTNKPGDGDFDFMMKIDNEILLDETKLNKLKEKISNKLVQNSSGAEKNYTGKGDFRFKGVNVGKNNDGEDVIVDIDITFVKKTDKISYSTDMCVRERLETIYNQDKEKYKYVVANILLAKEYLKKAGVYKPNRGETPQGGLGGVGVENWILQNGGSFIDAVNEFLEAAEGKTFDEFKKAYQVWNFGENHMSNGKYAHDNFVANNMSEVGYKKMVEALQKYKMNYDKNKMINKRK